MATDLVTFLIWKSVGLDSIAGVSETQPMAVPIMPWWLFLLPFVGLICNAIPIYLSLVLFAMLASTLATWHRRDVAAEQQRGMPVPLPRGRRPLRRRRLRR